MNIRPRYVFNALMIGVMLSLYLTSTGCYFIMREKIQSRFADTEMQISELEERISNLEARSDKTPATGSEVSAMYEKAMADYYSGDYMAARSGLKEVMTTYPDDPYAARSCYWIGESYYVEKEYSQALVYFEKTVIDYAPGDRTADATFKAGRVYEELGDSDKARVSYEKVLKEYPDSGAAGKARIRLDMMK